MDIRRLQVQSDARLSEIQNAQVRCCDALDSRCATAHGPFVELSYGSSREVSIIWSAFHRDNPARAGGSDLARVSVVG
jgi:hypothetical protein